ncbi:lipoxygenase 3, chloroplastic-like protein, partial [Tanacetum coccineum]
DIDNADSWCKCEQSKSDKFFIELGHQTLAGVNLVSLEKLKVFPLVSKLDPSMYGPPESYLKEGHIISHLNGIESSIRDDKATKSRSTEKSDDHSDKSDEDIDVKEFQICIEHSKDEEILSDNKVENSNTAPENAAVDS